MTLISVCPKNARQLEFSSHAKCEKQNTIILVEVVYSISKINILFSFSVSPVFAPYLPLITYFKPLCLADPLALPGDALQTPL